MLNAEKFKKEIKAITDKDNDFAIMADNPTVIEICNESVRCRSCLFYKGKCNVNRMRWLLSEYTEPIKLTKLEYDILKHLSDNTKYLYITRDRCNGLFLYGMEPTKGDGYWSGKYYAGMSAFNKLFQFIQWEDEKPTSIKEVLENCEVAEHESK